MYHNNLRVKLSNMCSALLNMLLIYMEVLKEGWIYEQSNVLKRLSKCWLVLSSDFLCTFKNTGESTPIHKIPTKDIQLAEKRQTSHKKGLFMLRVLSISKELVLYSSDSLSLDRWVKAIRSIIVPHQPDQEIKSKFQSLKRALDLREELLNQQNEL